MKLSVPFMQEGVERTRHQPLVSIITVVYNARHELIGLLDSVKRLSDAGLELIVVDGGSQDGSADILRARANELAYWVSEPDHGIYDAMNKAIAHARGTFLLHLNAGDQLLHIPKTELHLADREGVDVAAFRVALSGGREFEPGCGLGLRFNNTLHHQGTFFRRRTFLPYNLRFLIFADFDVNQRLAKAGARMKTFPHVVSFHSTDGISAQDNPAARKEFFSVIARNHGRSVLPIAWSMAKWRGLKARLYA